MSEDKKTSKIAIIRVRGPVKVKKKIELTMQLLKLHRKNYCVVIDATPNLIGMIKKVKDYTTFGEIDDETLSLLIEKRGEEYKDREKDRKEKIEYTKFVIINNKKYKPFFRLNPPKKGFGRKGIKVAFKTGGALGDRKEKINDLIKRML